MSFLAFVFGFSLATNFFLISFYYPRQSVTQWSWWNDSPVYVFSSLFLSFPSDIFLPFPLYLHLFSSSVLYLFLPLMSSPRPLFTLWRVPRNLTETWSLNTETPRKEAKQKIWSSECTLVTGEVKKGRESGSSLYKGARCLCRLIAFMTLPVLRRTKWIIFMSSDDYLHAATRVNQYWLRWKWVIYAEVSRTSTPAFR